MQLTEQERQALQQEAEIGRRWQTTLEVLEAFCDGSRQRIIDTLENGTAQNIRASVNMLNVIRQFRNNAQSYIDQGKMAERRLRDGED